MPLPSTSPAVRQPNFIRPQATVGRHHPMSLSMMLMRLPRVAGIGTSSAFRWPQSWPTTTLATTSKQAAPVWCAS
jgi:hypothetical protein